MKTTYRIVLGVMLLTFIGCGAGNTSTATKITEQAVPKTPQLEDREKVPPSIPKI